MMAWETLAKELDKMTGLNRNVSAIKKKWENLQNKSKC